MIKKFNKNIDKPRERLIIKGANVLSNEELIAILLGTGIKDCNVYSLSKEILLKTGKLSNFNSWTYESLKTIKGLGDAKITTLLAAYEFGKRCLKKELKYEMFKNANDLYNYFKFEFINEYQEKLVVILLDTKKRIINTKCVFVGTINSSTVHPREIFYEAIKNLAVSIVIIHNHPSGDSTPSKHDDLVTKNLVKLGKIVGIPVIDHIIIGNNNYYSYYNEKWDEINE